MDTHSSFPSSPPLPPFSFSLSSLYSFQRDADSIRRISRTFHREPRGVDGNIVRTDGKRCRASTNVTEERRGLRLFQYKGTQSKRISSSKSRSAGGSLSGEEEEERGEEEEKGKEREEEVGEEEEKREERESESMAAMDEFEESEGIFSSFSSSLSLSLFSSYPEKRTSYFVTLRSYTPHLIILVGLIGFAIAFLGLGVMEFQSNIYVLVWCLVGSLCISFRMLNTYTHTHPHFSSSLSSPHSLSFSLRRTLSDSLFLLSLSLPLMLPLLSLFASQLLLLLLPPLPVHVRRYIHSLIIFLFGYSNSLLFLQCRYSRSLLLDAFCLLFLVLVADSSRLFHTKLETEVFIFSTYEYTLIVAFLSLLPVALSIALDLFAFRLVYFEALEDMDTPRRIHLISADEEDSDDLSVTHLTSDPPSYWLDIPDSQNILSNADSLRSDISKFLSSFCRDTHNVTVLSVSRIRNPLLWSKYAMARKVISSEGSVIPVRTLCDTDWIDDTFHSHHSINEKILLHGTSKDIATKIAYEGFDIRVSSRSGNFGSGVYFTDHFKKSHRYSPVDSFGRRYLLVSRVCLGSAYYSDVPRKSLRRPPLHLLTGRPNDSIFGSVNRDGYVEYVVYSNDQCYPEFLVTYRSQESHDREGGLLS